VKHWTDSLYKWQPCAGGLAWARKFPTAQAAWDACERPEWMCWLLEKTGANNRDLTLLACEFARLALPYARGDAAELAIATAEQWAHGDEEVTLDDVRNARDAAAYAAANAAAYAAAYAADAAAAAAADAAAYAAACAAAYAAAAADAAADAAARVVTLRKCCDIIRRFYPEVPL